MNAELVAVLPCIAALGLLVTALRHLPAPTRIRTRRRVRCPASRVGSRSGEPGADARLAAGPAPP